MCSIQLLVSTFIIHRLGVLYCMFVVHYERSWGTLYMKLIVFSMVQFPDKTSLTVSPPLLWIWRNLDEWKFVEGRTQRHWIVYGWVQTTLNFFLSIYTVCEVVIYVLSLGISSSAGSPTFPPPLTFYNQSSPPSLPLLLSSAIFLQIYFFLSFLIHTVICISLHTILLPSPSLTIICILPPPYSFPSFLHYCFSAYPFPLYPSSFFFPLYSSPPSPLRSFIWNSPPRPPSFHFSLLPPNVIIVNTSMPGWGRPRLIQYLPLQLSL